MNNEIKTWDDLCNHPDTSPTDIGFFNDFEKLIEDYGQSETASAKSALAFLKIRLLIAEAYGGNPTFDEKNDWDFEHFGMKFTDDGEPWVCSSIADEQVKDIAFYTDDQAEEFMSHESNVQLVKDFYMVDN